MRYIYQELIEKTRFMSYIYIGITISEKFVQKRRFWKKLSAFLVVLRFLLGTVDLKACKMRKIPSTIGCMYSILRNQEEKEFIFLQI